MKYLKVLLLFLIFFGDGYGQSVKNDKTTEKNELSDYEFIKLEKGYAKMLQSETHSKIRENQKILIKKKNGLVYPDPKKDKKWLIDEAYTKKWLAKNIKKTNFVSVDEAYKLIWKSIELQTLEFKENPEVYKLLSRASKKQRLEVFRQLADYMRDHR